MTVSNTDWMQKKEEASAGFSCSPSALLIPVACTCLRQFNVPYHT